VSTDAAIARRGFRQVWIGATVCAVVFGLSAWSSAVTYASTFPTEASRLQIAATTSADKGLAVLLGPISGIDTVGGYTVYKVFVFLTSVGAVWAVLAATRVLRGQEDAGRWQLMLSGDTRPARATTATLLALGAAVGIIFLGTTALVLIAAGDPDLGLGRGEAVLYGLSLTVAPAVFVAVGAVTSQLGRTRRTATGLGIAVFAVAFVVRMVADTGPGTAWLRWATPFGWVELMRPFTANDAWPLVPAGVTVVVLGGLAVVLAGRRDAGDGLLASRDVSRPRPFGLGSVLGLSARLELPVLAAWCLGAVGGALMFGIVAKLTTASIPQSMTDILDRLGVEGSFADQYLGVAFLLLAAVIALLPASQVGAASAEETSGRLVHVLSRPPRRASWFAGRLALTAAATAVAGLAAGIATYVGARSQGVDLSFTSVVGAGLNVVPSALVALGIGAVVLAVAPRAASATVYAVVIWSVLIDLVGTLVGSADWLGRISLFHYMALAPSQPVELRTVAITLGVAGALCGAATVVFDRRDLRTA
jgi:ABC-2 type transport system permease protein